MWKQIRWGLNIAPTKGQGQCGWVNFSYLMTFTYYLRGRPLITWGGLVRICSEGRRKKNHIIKRKKFLRSILPKKKTRSEGRWKKLLIRTTPCVIQHVSHPHQQNYVFKCIFKTFFCWFLTTLIYVASWLLWSQKKRSTFRIGYPLFIPIFDVYFYVFIA